MKILLCSTSYRIGNLNDNNTIVIRNYNGIKETKLERDAKIDGLEINIKGKNNIIYLDFENNLRESSINIRGDNNIVDIKKSRYSCKLDLNMPMFNGIGANNRKIAIGENCYIGHAYIMCALSNERIRVGNGCFLSTNIHMRTSDSHALYDIQTGQLLNGNKNSIYIQDHCWIGEGAFLSKGTSLGRNTVVGAKAFVCKKFEKENIVIAGVPAKIIRENVNWDSKNTEAYLKSINEGKVNV